VIAPIVERDRYGDIDPDCVLALNHIVEQSGAEIVITSTWRYGKSVDQLQTELVEMGFLGRVIDVTSIEARGHTRGEEIAAWLANHPVDSYVILDDHRDMGELIENLVQTNARLGLREVDASRALEKLASRLGEELKQLFGSEL